MLSTHAYRYIVFMLHTVLMTCSQESVDKAVAKVRDAVADDGLQVRGAHASL